MQHKNIAIKKIFWLLAILSPVLISCNKYLDEAPSKSTSLQVTSTAQLEALLNRYDNFYSERSRTAIYSSDDNGLSAELYNARPAGFALTDVQFSLWDTENLPADNRESFWSGEWGKIFTANLVLSRVNEVSGTEADKAALTAEAHLIRAYSYWLLVNTYCLPYTEANRGEPGLPLKVSTSFEESVRRGTLEATYQLIESDVQEALKTAVPLMQNGRARHWRGNIAAANGFAARYYLGRNNYTAALQYANAALAHYSTLVDYNTEMRYGVSQTISIDPGTPQAQQVTLQFPYTHDNQIVMTDMLGWKEFMYFRMLRNDSWWYIPSQALLNLYDQEHDLRYRYHVVEGYSYSMNMTRPSYNYPGYIFFFKDGLPSGPTVAEMLLIKAECLARTNSVSEALIAVNSLREKRMLPGSWVNLTAGNQGEAVRKILEERRRELPYTQRWYDIRRFNNNEDPGDDVVISRSFFPYNNVTVNTAAPVQIYTLSENSRRYAAPLPNTDLISANGSLQQNNY